MKTNPLQKSARVCGVNASVEIHLLFKPKLEKKKNKLYATLDLIVINRWMVERV